MAQRIVNPHQAEQTSSTPFWPSVKRIILIVGVVYFGLYAFMFRDIILHLPQLMRGEMVINGDELVPFFNPHSQFIDQVKGEFNELAHGYEFRVRYSILTTWMRYYKILPFALLLVIPAVAFGSYLAVSYFLQRVMPHESKEAIFRASAAPILVVFLIMTYAKITHFYTLIVGFGLFLISTLFLCYGLLFTKKHPYRYMTIGCLLSLFNPAVHYIILFSLYTGVVVVGTVIIETVQYLAGGNIRSKLRPSPLWQMFRQQRHRIMDTMLVRCVAAFFLLGAVTLVPYALLVKFFFLKGIGNLSETIPVTYYFIKDASVSFLHLISFDLAGIMDKFIAGDYLVKHPRLTNVTYSIAMVMPLLAPDIRRTIFATKPLRSFFILCYGILAFSIWASLGYSDPEWLPTFHRTMAAISKWANATRSTPGDLIVKLMGTVVQVLRFPHRFQLILFMTACIIMPVSTVWIEGQYRSRVRSSVPSKHQTLLNGLFPVLFLLPLMMNWQYYETFLSGNFKGFLSPYPVGPLQEVKAYLLELPEGKSIVLPPTETAKRIIDIEGVEHKFIDKFHIYYLDLPSYYYGLSGDTRNKHEFFLMLRAMYYEQDWWVNVARDNFVRYIIINKELVANTVGGAEYLREIEKTIVPQIEQLDDFFRKIFENESYIVFEFIDLPNAERIPLFIDTDWNTFIRIQSANLDLSKYYDLRYGMIADDLAEYENLVVVADDAVQAAVDVYAKTHTDQFFRPNSSIFPFDKNIVPSTYYIAPMFRMFQFFSDSKWNRLEMITPGMYGTVTGTFIGVPNATSFRIDVRFPQAGVYRLLLRGVSTANELTVDAPELELDEYLRLDPSDTHVLFFEQERVFSPDREPIDVGGYSTEELEVLIPSKIVVVNYEFGYIDLGTVHAPEGSYTIYFDKHDDNPMLVEGVLVIPEEVYQDIGLPANVHLIAPDEDFCCDELPVFVDEERRCR